MARPRQMQAFTFHPHVETPSHDASSGLTLTADQLARLLREARADGFAAARDVVTALEDRLGDIAVLIARLDTIAQHADRSTRDDLMTELRRAADDLRAGQRDLFAGCGGIAEMES